MSLGRTISALCPVIPGGLLVFFPSYFIMNKCKATWQEEVSIKLFSFDSCYFGHVSTDSLKLYINLKLIDKLKIFINNLTSLQLSMYKCYAFDGQTNFHIYDFIRRVSGL